MGIKPAQTGEPKLAHWPDFFAQYKFSLFSRALGLEKFIRAIMFFVPKGETILETGFGTGYASLLLAEMGYSVTAIEIEAELVGKLQGKGRGFPTLKVARADMFRLPFKNDSFYAVIHQGVLEHFSDRQISRALAEQARVASQLIIFDVPNERARVPNEVKNTPLDFRPLNRKVWKRFILEAGLTLEYEYGTGCGANRATLGLFYLIPHLFHRLNYIKVKSPFNWLGSCFGSSSGFVCRKT